MREVSLVLLIKENQILLAMKKRGFGVGRWNGVGGKIDKELGDSNVLDSAIRETKEEIVVNIKNPEKYAIIDFYFPKSKKHFNQQVHIYMVKEWGGEPEETEEMKPKWFDIQNIPYNNMWDDDKFWLPLFLKNKKTKCKFFFDDDDKIINKEINIVNRLK